MVTFAKNILEFAGDLLLCAGQRSRYEAAIHKFDTQRRNFRCGFNGRCRHCI